MKVVTWKTVLPLAKSKDHFIAVFVKHADINQQSSSPALGS